MSRTSLAILLSALPLLAQEAPPSTVSPTRVDLGVVRVGAVVEGDIRVEWNAPAGGAEAKIEIPATMRSLATETHTGNDRTAVTEFGFGVVTKVVGRHDENVVLRLGDRIAKVAVTWTVEPAIAGGSRVLVADSPFRGESSDDPSTFDAWRRLVERARLDVDYRYSRKNFGAFDAGALARVDIVIVGEGSLVRLSESEIARLQGFVCGGGRVVVFANAFYVGTVKAANELCEPFGLSMVDRDTRPGPSHEADFEGVHRHPLTVGVDSIVARRPSPTIVTDKEVAAPLVDLPVLGSERPFAAIATTKSGGEIITIGNSLWWLWIGQAPGNERMLRNLLVRPPRLR